MPTYSEWRGEPCCVACGKNLNRRQEYYSGGVCPFCGHDSRATVVDTVNRIYRLKWDDGYWWKFWKTPQKEYKNVSD